MAKIAKTSSLDILPKYCVKRVEYNPDVIFNHGMREVIITDDSKGIYEKPSLTDKEAYRVTLASMRGNIRSLGSASTGKYSLQSTTAALRFRARRSSTGGPYSMKAPTTEAKFSSRTSAA